MENRLRSNVNVERDFGAISLTIGKFRIISFSFIFELQNVRLIFFMSTKLKIVLF